MIWKEDNDLIEGLKKGNMGLLGFEDFFNNLVALKANANYPHYNIEKLNENQWSIVIAVAGFVEKDIDISLDGMQLIIRGSKSEEDPNKEYIFKGIANRSFQRSFLLAEGVKICKADLENGLLKIFLEKPQSENKTIKIPITNNNKKLI